MTIPQYVITGIFLIILFISFRKGNDIASPGKAFLLVWGVAIFLCEFKFSGFQYEWNYFSWIVLIIGLASFMVGNYSAFIINIGKPIKSINEIRSLIQTPGRFDNQKLFTINIILFLLYGLSYLFEFLVIGNLPIFSAHFDRARIDYGIFGVHLFVNFQFIIMFLNAEYLIIEKKQKYKKFVVWMIFFLTALSFALLLQRFNFFIYILMAFALLYYGGKIITFKKVIITLVIFFGFLSLIQTIRLSQYASQFIYVISRMKYGKEWAILTEPYMYIVMNLENFARLVANLNYHTYGLLTGDWLAALFGIKHWAKDYFIIEQKQFINSNFNTFIFLWNYFYDFGIMGVLIFPLFTGLFVGLNYYNMRRTGDLRFIVNYSVCLSLIIISFFTNPIIMLSWVVPVFVLWIIHKYFFYELVP
jgi:oligosaccharide repeat unit polymerase